MKIDTNSRFYKFLEFLKWVLEVRDIPNNVCALFWFIVAGGLKIAIVALGAILVGIVLLLWVGTAIDAIFYYNWFMGGEIDSVIITFAVLFWVIVGGISIIVVRNLDGYENRKDILAIFKDSNDSENSDGGVGVIGVVVGYIKAKKEKICPRIEFVNLKSKR